MATWPQTSDEIVARLDTIQTLIQTYETAPEKFAVLFGGSIKVDPKTIVDHLRLERKELEERLTDLPFFRGSIPEQLL